MTIHHTSEVLGDNRNIISRLRQHQQFHQEQRGWIDIAYHIAVDRNGIIFESRSTDLAGDTATNYDPTGHFLVVCEGNLDEEEVTENQLIGAALALPEPQHSSVSQPRHWLATETFLMTLRAPAETSTSRSHREN